ncbi:MAG: hypothetical protein QG629_248 [Patescibacteria group bacterium]|nr:GlsB/YeaQ/YmgE family stress response membrane protein [Candidatus Saccharibacteria bacterium]MDQ5963166.1 hypothetical protein [Patescibacteria group bacterium]
MNILLWVVVGAFAGWIASMLMKTDAQMGAFANIAAGIAGAFVGGWLSSQLLNYDPNVFSLPGILIAIVGAMIVIFIVQLITGRRRV